MKQNMTKNPQKPDYILSLEAIYGPSSQDGFGSAIFTAQMSQEDSLEDLAKQVYQQFVGQKWQDWGPETWLAPWKEVYARDADAAPDIVQELRAIDDPTASSSVPMILDVVENAEEGQKALAAAFDAPQMQDVRVYNIGDGEAYSGLIIAGRCADGATTCLVFLLD